MFRGFFACGRPLLSVAATGLVEPEGRRGKRKCVKFAEIWIYGD
jgi:hypothetical protein